MKHRTRPSRPKATRSRRKRLPRRLPRSRKSNGKGHIKSSRKQPECGTGTTKEMTPEKEANTRKEAKRRKAKKGIPS